MEKQRVYSSRGIGRLLVNTGHKTFDRQTVSISKGNVISSTQLSFYIRAYNDTTCNGFDFAPGALQEIDLKLFKDAPKYVLDYVKEICQNQSHILYEFHHGLKGDRKLVHGYAVTDAAGCLKKKFITGPNYKSERIVDECLEYIL